MKLLISSLESKEPVFLRKLRNEHGGGNSDRHERTLARPRKQKNCEDDDDEPIYIDEQSNDTLTKAQYEAILKNEEHVNSKEKHSEALISNDDGAVIDDVAKDVVVDPSSKKALIAAIGGTGKRRIAKVIGEDGQDQNGKECLQEASVEKRSMKKLKKIKLSFDDEATGSLH